MTPIYANIKAFFDLFLGIYTPITYSDGSVNIIPAGLAGVDWSYLVRAFAFLLIVYCLFRLVGGLFQCK